ncbi:MAG: hypothetical protein JXR31_16505, partial [Prolixibacteraceae bacterium]|nr:hypothetical protein [Prolixibacteraceae bacterium]
AKAVGLNENLDKIKTFISEAEKENLNTPELYSLMLMESIVSDKSKKPSLVALINLFFRKKQKTNLPYRIFLFLITFDNFYKRTLFVKLLIRFFLLFYKPDTNSPCSMTAALLVVQNFSGKKTSQVNQKLLAYFDEKKGFKMYHQNKASDLLSTAVALFAMKISGQDLRLVAPTCLDLVQQNYSDGAFLSGDGDQIRDLEYTFYGLLALGVLA